MNVIGSKKLYQFIMKGLIEVVSVTNKYHSNTVVTDDISVDKFIKDLETVSEAGMFDIIRWEYNVSGEGIVRMTADLQDRYLGEYIEFLGKVSDNISLKNFLIELEAFSIRI